MISTTFFHYTEFMAAAARSTEHEDARVSIESADAGMKCKSIQKRLSSSECKSIQKRLSSVYCFDIADRKPYFQCPVVWR